MRDKQEIVKLIRLANLLTNRNNVNVNNPLEMVMNTEAVMRTVFLQSLAVVGTWCLDDDAPTDMDPKRAEKLISELIGKADEYTDQLRRELLTLTAPEEG